MKNKKINFVLNFIISIFVFLYFFSFFIVLKKEKNFQNLKIKNIDSIKTYNYSPLQDSLNFFSEYEKNKEKLNFTIFSDLSLKKIDENHFEIIGSEKFLENLKKIEKINFFLKKIIPASTSIFESFPFKNYFLSEKNLENYYKILPKIEKISDEFGNFNYGIEKIFNNFEILLLFQNPLEARPTGGFIGSYAYIKIENKIIEIIEVRSSYAIEDYRKIVEPPSQIKKVYPNWTFRDSNFFFSFEESAKKAIEFFGRDIDSVVFINPTFLQIFIEEFGDLKIKDQNLIINKKNIFTGLGFFGEAEHRKNGFYSENSKNFLGEIFSEIIKKTSQKNNFFEDKNFLNKILASLYKRDLVFYFSDKKLNSLAKYLRIDGDLPNYDENYFSYIEANLSGSKSSWNIKKDISINISEDFSKYEIEIKFFHTGNQNFLDGDYNGFFKFFIPQNTKDIILSGFDDPPSIVKTEKIVKSVENQRFFAGGWIKLKPNEEKIVKIKYQLNSAENYFIFFPQSGARNQTLKILLNGNVEKILQDPVLQVKIIKEKKN